MAPGQAKLDHAKAGYGRGGLPQYHLFLMNDKAGDRSRRCGSPSASASERTSPGGYFLSIVDGFASRGVRLMVRYAVQAFSVRRLIAFIEPDNLASRGVARKTGFTELELGTRGDRPRLRRELVC